MADAGEAPVEASEAPVEDAPAQEEDAAAGDTAAGAEAPVESSEAPVAAAPAQEEVAAAGDTAAGDGGAEAEAGEAQAAPEQAAPADPPPQDKQSEGGEEKDGGEGDTPPVEVSKAGGEEAAPEQAAPADPALEDEKSEGGEGKDGGDGDKEVEVPSKFVGADGAILEDGATESPAPPAAALEQDTPPAAALEQDSSPVKKGGGKGKEEKGKGEKDDLEDDLPEVTEVRIASETKMASELKQIAAHLNKNQPWKTRAIALRRLRGMILGGAITSLAFSKGLLAKDLSDQIPHLFSELRSQVVKEASDFATDLAAAAAAADQVKVFDTFCSECVLPEALKATTRANPVIVASADACVKSIAKEMHALRILRAIIEPIADAQVANSKLRLHAGEALRIILEVWTEARLKSGLVTMVRDTVSPTQAIEMAIKQCLSDSKTDTRQAGKDCHDKYLERFPARRKDFHALLTKQQLRTALAAGAAGAAAGSESEGEGREKARKRRPAPSKLPSAVSEVEGAEGGEEGVLREKLTAAVEKLERMESTLEHERRRVKGLKKLKEQVRREKLNLGPYN